MSDMRLYVSERLNEKYYEIDHSSGLKIFVFPKALSTFSGIIGVRFGSADDRFTVNGREILLPAGTAHFLEHKMFENSDGVNSDERFAALGAEANAYTTYNSTRFQFGATENAGQCVAELIKLVFQPYFTPENVKKERGIIAQEIMMYADDPYECVIENAMRAMYKNRGIKNPVCGTVASIEKITDTLLNRVYQAFYRPENAVLSVCGDITPEQVISEVDRGLDGYRATGDNVALSVPCEPDTVVVPRIEKKMRVARPLFFIGVKDPFKGNCRERMRRSLAMSVLNSMLFSETGEFYSRLTEEHLITPAFSFGYSAGNAGCLNSFSGNSDEPYRVYGLINEKLRDAQKNRIDRSDFERCRRSALAGYIRMFDSTAEIADDAVLSSCLNGVGPFEIPEIIENLTFEYTEELLNEVFREERSAISVVLPLN